MMIKEKITRKLCLYFGLAIVIFALIVGGIFALLFRNYTINNHRQELFRQAYAISDSLKEYFEQGDATDFKHGQKPMENKGGIGGYLRLVDDITETNVWIIDKNKKLVTIGQQHGAMGNNYQYSDIPQNADTIIQEVFLGKTTFNQDFSNIMDEPTLTVGVPIKNSKKDIVGVVLLHSSVKGINDAIYQGFIILSISGLIAFFIVIILSLGLSYSFTKPLNKMKSIALKLAEGDYLAKNNIGQKDEIGELANTLDLLADRLDEASKQSERFEKLRREFIANVSHELRTPVAVIRGSLEALVDKVVTDEKMVDDYHKQMLNESKYLGRLVGDLLDLARLQNVDFVIEKQDILICDVLDDVIRSAKHLAQQKNIEIKVNYKNTQGKIQGDYGRLRQMFLIVIDNAIKFSLQDSIIEINFKENVLTIRDYGVGISTEQLPHIFDRFYKSRSEHNKTGTGLGLAIAKQIAERHNIVLMCESNIGNGTVFIFKLETYELLNI